MQALLLGKTQACCYDENQYSLGSFQHLALLPWFYKKCDTCLIQSNLRLSEKRQLLQNGIGTNTEYSFYHHILAIIIRKMRPTNARSCSAAMLLAKVDSDCSTAMLPAKLLYPSFYFFIINQYHNIVMCTIRTSGTTDNKKLWVWARIHVSTLIMRLEMIKSSPINRAGRKCLWNAWEVEHIGQINRFCQLLTNCESGTPRQSSYLIKNWYDSWWSNNDFCSKKPILVASDCRIVPRNPDVIITSHDSRLLWRTGIVAIKSCRSMGTQEMLANQNRHFFACAGTKLRVWMSSWSCQHCKDVPNCRKGDIIGAISKGILASCL